MTEVTKEDLIAFNNILKSLEEGLSLRKSIKLNKTTKEVFYKVVESDEQYARDYYTSKSDGIDRRFESIEEDYLEEPQRDPETGKIDTGWVQLQRLKIDAKKWELSKLKPKKYGDKLDVEQSGGLTITWQEEKTYLGDDK